MADKTISELTNALTAALASDTGAQFAAEQGGVSYNMTLRELRKAAVDAFNVLDYGAVGNGSTDDTSAIQQAIDAAYAAKGTVFLPNGTYIISSPLTYKVPMRGEAGPIGWNYSDLTYCTVIKVSPAQSCNGIEVPDGTKGWEIRDLNVIAADSGIKSGGGESEALYYRISNVRCRACNTGFELDGFIGVLDNCWGLLNDDYGLDLTSGNGVTIIGGEWKDNGSAAMRVQGSHVNIQGCVVENNDSYGIELRATDGGGGVYSLDNVYFESNAGGHIVGGDNDSGQIIYVNIDNCTSTPSENFLDLKNTIRLSLNNSGCRSGWPTILLDNVEQTVSNCLPLWSAGGKPNIRLITKNSHVGKRVTNLVANPNGIGGIRGWYDSTGSNITLTESTDVFRDATVPYSLRCELGLTSGSARLWLQNQTNLASLLPGRNLNCACWVMVPSIVTFTGGSGTEPSSPMTVTGGTSGATATLVLTSVSGGSFASADAAGTFEFSSKSGTFSVGETLTFSNSATATVATVPLTAVTSAIPKSYYRDDAANIYGSVIYPAVDEDSRGWWQSAFSSAPVVNDGSVIDRFCFWLDMTGTSGGVCYLSDIVMWIDDAAAGWNEAVNGRWVQDERFGVLKGTSIHRYGSAAPSDASIPAAVGDITWNTSPSASGTIGWVCTTAGSPGTWKTFGTIAS